MRLDDFIAKSLADIVSGVRKAQQNHKSVISDGIVNPYFVDDKDHHRRDLTQDINFDIAVEVTDTEKLNGGGKISVLNIVDVGANKGTETQNSQVNRIQFSIPYLYPFFDIREKDDGTQSGTGTFVKTQKKD